MTEPKEILKHICHAEGKTIVKAISANNAYWLRFSDDTVVGFHLQHDPNEDHVVEIVFFKELRANDSFVRYKLGFLSKEEYDLKCREDEASTQAYIEKRDRKDFERLKTKYGW